MYEAEKMTLSRKVVSGQERTSAWYFSNICSSKNLSNLVQEVQVEILDICIFAPKSRKYAKRALPGFLYFFYRLIKWSLSPSLTYPRCLPSTSFASGRSLSVHGDEQTSKFDIPFGTHRVVNRLECRTSIFSIRPVPV